MFYLDFFLAKNGYFDLSAEPKNRSSPVYLSNHSTMSQGPKVTISCGENYDEYKTPNPEKGSFTDT